jgi:hypothetical protein
MPPLREIELLPGRVTARSERLPHTHAALFNSLIDTNPLPVFYYSRLGDQSQVNLPGQERR